MYYCTVVGPFFLSTNSLQFYQILDIHCTCNDVPYHKNTVNGKKRMSMCNIKREDFQCKLVSLFFHKRFFTFILQYFWTWGYKMYLMFSLPHDLLDCRQLYIDSSRAPTTFKLEGEVGDNREKWRDFWEKLIAINRNIVNIVNS